MQIDEVKPYIEGGYEFTIFPNFQKDCFYSNLTLWASPLSIAACHEVEVGEWIHLFPNLMDHLKPYRFCRISYDDRTKQVISEIQIQEFEGPYCEQTTYKTVPGMMVKTSNIFDGLIELDTRIASIKQEKKKKKITKELK